MDLDLAQRGRAIMDWKVTARKMANSPHAASVKEFKSHGLTVDALRLLRPAGVMLFADAPPYRAFDKLASWSLDWIARYLGEPYWKEARVNAQTKPTDDHLNSSGEHPANL